MEGHFYFSNGRMLHFAKKIRNTSFLALKATKPSQAHGKSK
jgi:hypothetical protein